MSQLRLEDSIRITTDDQGRLNLILRKDFYEFLTRAKVKEASEKNEGYVILEAEGVSLKERMAESSTEYARVDSPEIRLEVARFGDDPPCYRKWQ